ncbi:MAG: glycosyltransferase family 39 protein [Planctomycetes bacterium]|nr:glycosyltransferase family 39 protein [Planctomycetota bacterium]
MTTGHSHWFAGAFVLACTALGAFFRSYDAGGSLWLDELHTAWTVSDGIADVLPRARMGHQSPLFFWIEWCSVQILGPNEWALRLPSLAAGIALIPLAAAVAFRWSRFAAAAAFASALVATDYFCTWYAQDARPYALVQLFGLLHVAAFLELCQRPSWTWRLAFVLLSLVLFHLQYTSALLLAGELAFYGWMAWGRHRRPAYRPISLAFDLAVIAAGIVPVLPWLAATAAERTNWAQFVPLPTSAAVIHLFPVTAYVVFPLLLAVMVNYGSNRLWLERTLSENGRELALLACWFVAPLAIAWLCTWLDVARLFYRRYLMICALAPMLASAMLVARFSARSQAAFIIAAATLSQIPLALATVQLTPAGGGSIRHYLLYGEFTSHAREDWRGAVNIVRTADSEDRLPVFVRSGLIESARLNERFDPALREYSLLPVTGIYSLDQPGRELLPLPPADRVQLTPQQLDQLINRGGGWLILRGNFGIDRVAVDLLGDLTARGATARLESRWNLRGVTVLRVEAGR